jgi:hypothetical protein
MNTLIGVFSRLVSFRDAIVTLSRAFNTLIARRERAITLRDGTVRAVLRLREVRGCLPLFCAGHKVYMPAKRVVELWSREASVRVTTYSCGRWLECGEIHAVVR